MKLKALFGKDKSFEEAFGRWLDSALSVPIPAEVVSFSFNLVELPTFNAADPRFGVELIGATSFSKEDSDWACDDAFKAAPAVLEIPVSFSGDAWDECLRRMHTLITRYLTCGSAGADKLNSAVGVGIGFVDGDLHLVRS
ncbi:MAG: hypothetical protein AAFQ79_17490 [Pseudomonadota bacterium]